jgi:ABC-2 type transport system permease protein
MTSDLLPDWMHTVARFNPVNWAIEAGRSATAANPDWGLIAGYVGLLALGLVLAATLATQAFRTYQRSV